MPCSHSRMAARSAGATSKMRFQHLLFQRLQAAHRVDRLADAEQGVQIANGPAGGLT